MNTLSHRNNCKYCELNDLLSNESKCNMSYKKLTNKYKINRTELKVLNSIKDLGVAFNKKLFFIVHYKHLTCECYRTLGLVHDFNSYVRYKLEYCTPI